MAHLLEPFAGDRSGTLSARLIDRFGSLGGILSASREQLEDAGGEDREICGLIAAARELIEAGLREKLVLDRVEPTDPNLLKYLRLQFGGQPSESLYAIFVDQQRRYIRGECIGQGSRGGIEARMSHLFRRVVELRASGILLAHNHPSGNHRPSRADLNATARIRDTAFRLDLELLDHLIVTNHAVYSISQERVL